MFKLIRKSSTLDELENSERFSKVEEINKILEEGWEVKHIESFVIQDKILITQLLVYKKDVKELNNTKTERATVIDNIPTFGQVYGDQNN